MFSMFCLSTNCTPAIGDRRWRKVRNTRCIVLYTYIYKGACVRKRNNMQMHLGCIGYIIMS